MINALKFYFRLAGASGVVSAIKRKVTRKTTLIKVHKPYTQYPFYLRTGSSDLATFDQIFLKKEYDFNVTTPPNIIVDAGANIGLASLYFSNKFPNTRIIAIEPEESNFELLKINVKPYQNIIPIKAALWHEDKMINLVDPNLGKWGFITQAQDTNQESFGDTVHDVRGMTVDTMMREQGIEHIDILKMDIEGSEREVFRDPSPWIRKIDALIIELHERLKVGCNRSFYNGTNGFDDEWHQGENIYLVRRRGCLIKTP